MEIKKAIEELRKSEKRKFVQTVDLIVNLKEFDPRKEGVNSFAQIPNPLDKNVCAFLTRNTKLVDTITKEDFDKYNDPKEMKKLAKKYDAFIAVAPMMGDIATKFGRVLGPVGKMPSPQAGIIPVDGDDAIKEVLEKVKKSVRLRTKEMSLKVVAGKEDMSDEKLEENISALISGIENALPRGKDNVKDILLKFTMTKPVKLND